MKLKKIFPGVIYRNGITFIEIGRVVSEISAFKHTYSSAFEYLISIIRSIICLNSRGK